MSILTQKLPKAVLVDGQVYDVAYDFRTCLKIITAFEDRELAAIEKQMIMLKLFYKDRVPEDAVKACETAVKFLNCGEIYVDNEESAGSNLGRLYSFTQDAKYIFTAINQTHGVDLEAVDDLHWWKFSAFFLDLREDCFFCRLTYLRKQKKLGKMSKEEQAWYYSIQKIVDFEGDDIVADDENLNEFLALLNEGESALRK